MDRNLIGWTAYFSVILMEIAMFVDVVWWQVSLFSSHTYAGIFINVQIRIYSSYQEGHKFVEFCKPKLMKHLI